MKKIIFSICVLLLLSQLPSLCQIKSDTTNKKTTPPKDRNMYGHGIPRGLTKTSEGLSDGYVMFTPPNSAFVYLVDRKGQVVHEWKGNYSTHNAYLQDDGSVIQAAVDPDFPVFGGGGEAGRLQKISW